MKQVIRLVLAAWVGGLVTCTTLAAAAADEAQLIAVLQGNNPVEQKDAACAQLKRTGTTASVPALAALLTDEQLSHSARYALESLPAPEAGIALVAALDRTSGLLKAGILQSLGQRATAPVPALAKCLEDADATVAAAAARALGKRGTDEAVKALQAALAKASGPFRAAIVDGLLTGAENLRLGANPAAAIPIYQMLTGNTEVPGVRQAAFCGLMRGNPKRGLDLIKTGLQGTDNPMQLAALQMAGEIKNPDASRELAALLPKLTPVVQAALIDILRQRGDAVAAPAILELMASAEVNVRVAAAYALGELGDAKTVPALLKAAISKDADEQKSARRALARMRGNLADALLTMLPGATPALQAEITQTLASRSEKSAVPRLLELAKNGPDSAKPAALRALAQLADGSHLAALVGLIQTAANDGLRDGAQESLLEVCRRTQGQPGFDPAPIVNGLKGDAAARPALYTVCAPIRHDAVRTALRAGLSETAAKARAAAARAICETADAQLLPDLLALAKSAPEASIRVLATRGYVRLVGEDETGLSSAQRSRALRDIFALAARAEEKRLVLAKLATAPTLDSLNFAAGLMNDNALQGEAVQAVIQLAGTLSGAEPNACATALQTAMEKAPDDARKKAAQAILNQIETRLDYLTAWQVAGPYEQAGKAHNELFDIVFAPETPEAKGVNWKLLPPGTDAQRPNVMDILKALGGEQRVAYVRTQIYSEKDQPAQLELGSDDGVKVWLNGKLVHAKNVARPLLPPYDKFDVTLKSGWNPLMIKITQNNLGWEYCARFLKPDGSRLTGVKYKVE